MTLDARLFADDPARDERFTVRDRWAEVTNFPPGHPEATTEFLHRQMNEEINGLEISARNLVDYPDADWELRLAIARQCWDEARHIEMFRRYLERRSGHVGKYPVMNFQFRILTKIDTLIGRLAVQNRSFEAAGIDAIHQGIRESGDDADLAELFDVQLADEVQHVRYANVWVKKLAERSGPRALIDMARAVAHANEALKIVAGEAALTYPVADDVRREAGFSEAEIEAVRAMTI
ncbi:MAG TPA: DUF455 family protein [Thermoanaerobaculia bacterium]|nr:DUF455 family protein [Thermoanaerobaculia bacterium]